MLPGTDDAKDIVDAATTSRRRAIPRRALASPTKAARAPRTPTGRSSSSARDQRRPRTSTRRQLLEHLLVFREAAFAVLRKEELPVEEHVELARRSSDELVSRPLTL